MASRGAQGTAPGTGPIGGARTARRWAVVVAIVGSVLLAAVGASCSSEGEPAASAPKATTTTEPATSTTSDAPDPADTEPEAFTGSVDDFYVVPDPLPAGRPGDVIRVQPVSDDATSVVVRVMYHSRDAQDHDRAVTGTIAYPKAAAPADGWPVVSWAHGTTGLSSACASSRGGDAGPAFGVEGVQVATDYIGLGPVGERHPYLSGLSEGHSVIDGVRAARDLADAHAGSRWLAAGHSQGGHAALWTNELGAAYAPELDLLGTAVVAPAAVLTRTFGSSDQVVPRMVGIMALYGLAADYPEVEPDDYVGPAVAKVDGTIDSGCASDVINAMVGLPADGFYAHDPQETQPAKDVLAANDPGHVSVDSPMLLIYGSADTWVVPDRAVFLLDQLCDVDQVVDAQEVDGATHDTVTAMGTDRIAAWFAARLADEPAPDACPEG